MPAAFILEEVLNTLRKVLQSTNTLVIFRGILADPAVASMLQLLELVVEDSPRSHLYSKKLAETYALFFSALSAQAELELDKPVGNAWQNHLLNLIASNENIFSHKAELTDLSNFGESFVQQVKEDLRKLQKLYLLDATQILWALHQTSPDTGWMSWDRFQSVADKGPSESNGFLLKHHLRQNTDWASAVDLLADFYSKTGVGVFGQFKAFRWRRILAGGFLEGIASPDPIRLEDLVGCDDQKEWLVRNTTHFLAGFPANNVFVYGDRGTGKSSAIKALLHHFVDQSLRLLEISREDLADLPEVMKLLQPRRESFIVFVDDLSFEEGETQYKTLKAVLEGGLEARPANVVIYATSNRRHLIREYFSDREALNNGEVRHQDTLQEKVSLADRFGIQLAFVAPDQNQYLAIIQSMARRRGLQMPAEELNKQALQWAQLHNGRSGRTARQFMDFLTAELKLAKETQDWGRR